MLRFRTARDAGERLLSGIRSLPFTRRQVGTTALVAAAAFASTLIYVTYGRPPSGGSEVVLTRGLPVAQATTIVTASLASPGTDLSSATPPPSASTERAPTAVGAGPNQPPATAQLLRPGADAIERFDVSLDGSASGQVAISSRYTVTSGCQPVYVDVYSFRDGRWQRVLDATDPGMQYGALLPPPESTPAGCFPKL